MTVVPIVRQRFAAFTQRRQRIVVAAEQQQRGAGLVEADDE